MIEKCHILMLNQDLTLELIKELLKLDYTFIPKSLNGCPNESEYKNENKWYEVEEITEIYGVRYFQAKAQMEISEGTPFYHDGSIKPKDKRVNRINTSVVFLELRVSETKKFTCLLVEGSNTLLSNLKSNLLGGKREIKGIKERWNICKDLPYLNFSSEFFIWTLLKKEKILNGNIKIEDINFLDDIHESHNRKHQMYGDNVLNDILANLALALDPKLLSLGMVICSAEGRFDFILGSDSSIYLSDKTYLLSNIQEVIPIDEDSKKIVYVYIYGNLLKQLLNIFYCESGEIGWLSNKKDIFLREQGLNSFFKLSNHLGFHKGSIEIKDLENDPEEETVRAAMILFSKSIFKKFQIKSEEVFEADDKD